MDGLARFDGVRFTVFDRSNSPGINSNRFTSLYLDRNGDLWMGTENSGVTRYHQGKFTTFTTLDGLPHNFITGITGDEAGNLWMISAEKLVRWDNGRFVPAYPNGLKIDFQCSLWDPSVFFGVDETGLYRFAHGRLTTWPFPEGLPRRNINSLAEDHNGTIWVWTYDRRIAKIKDGKLIYLSKRSAAPPAPQTVKIFNPEMTITYQDRQHNLWTIGVGNDLLRTLTFLSSGQPERISFHNLFEDRDGNLWLGTGGQGLYRMRKQTITVYSKQHGLVDKNVYVISEDRSGAIWIGAWKSGLSRFKDGTFTNFTTRDGLASGLVTAIEGDRTGRLWVAVRRDNGGLQVFNDRSNGRGSSFSTLSDQIFPYRTVVAVIHQDRQGAIWFGTNRGLARYQDGAYVIYTAKDGLAGENVRVIIEDATGGLWIGSYGGLTRYKDGKFTGWTERDGLPSNNIRALYEDRENVLWIGTYDGGLGRFKDSRFTCYTTREGLYNNGVFQILEDPRGNFWMSCNRGIYRVSKQELNEFAAGDRRSITSIAYGKSDGMLNVECNGSLWPAGIRARDGKLWFPTQDGVAVIDPETIRVNQQPPAVVIESFLLDREPVAIDPTGRAAQAVRITPNSENFEIQFTALGFINPEHIKFKYQLTGLDRDWVDAGARRTAYYSHVPPGE